MTTSTPDPNPDALPGAPVPSRGLHRVNGTTLYAEVRGRGPTVLLIPGGAEDAEGWRPVAERLDGYTVVTYDRRGTRRSGREDWPGEGSIQHADDAAVLLRDLGLGRVTVFGASSGGIVALRLALRHPDAVGGALVYEPGFLRAVPAGERLQRDVVATIATHLAAHPDDWSGAYGAFTGMLDGASDVVALPGRAWYARREAGNAEPFLRDDVRYLTDEMPDEAALAVAPVEVRFSHGSGSPTVFREIASHLAALGGVEPDVIEGGGHALYLQADVAAAYIRSRLTT